MLAADRRDVEALDADRQLLHAERLRQRAEALDPAGAAVLAAQAVLVEGQLGVALGELAEAAFVAALGRVDVDRGAAALGQRFGDRRGAVAQLGADDDRPRHRGRGRVVLADELLGDLGEVAFALVVEVEGLALGEDAVADLEDLGVGVGTLGGDADQVGGPDRAAGDALALEQRADRFEAVAVERGALEFLGRRGLGHFLFLLLFDLAVAAGEEVDDRVDVAPVLLLGDVADAGRPAALDVVVEAGAAGAAARLGAVAGAGLEQFAEQVEGLAQALGAAERAEVGAVGAVFLAGEVDAGVVLVEADGDVGVGLVVAQADVEARAVALDEALLGEQRLGLVGGDEGVDPLDPAGQARLAAAEVRGDPFFDRARLADVEQLVVLPVEEVDARLVGQLAALLGDPFGAGQGAVAVLVAHKSKGRVPSSPPNDARDRERDEHADRGGAAAGDDDDRGRGGCGWRRLSVWIERGMVGGGKEG